MNENPKDSKQIDIDAIIDRVVRQVLERERAKESAHPSSGTYTDQPILQKGSDWRRSLGGRDAKAPHPKAESAREQDGPTADQGKRAASAQDRPWGQKGAPVQKRQSGQGRASVRNRTPAQERPPGHGHPSLRDLGSSQEPAPVQRAASAHEEPPRPSRSQSPTSRHGAGESQRQNDRSRKASDQQVIDYYSRLLDQEFGPVEGYGRGSYDFDASDYPHDQLLDEAFDGDVLAFGGTAQPIGGASAGRRYGGRSTGASRSGRSTGASRSGRSTGASRSGRSTSAGRDGDSTTTGHGAPMYRSGTSEGIDQRDAIRSSSQSPAYRGHGRNAAGPLRPAAHGYADTPQGPVSNNHGGGTADPQNPSSHTYGSTAANSQRPDSYDYGSTTASQGAWGRWPYGGRSDPHHEPKVELPPLLKKLRNLESSHDDDGQPLRGARLFVRQARLARDFEDNYEGYALPAYHYLPTYAELSDGELRSYFTWRTQWRHGTNSATPALWATLLAYEFIDGVGCEPGPEVVRRLLDLSNSVDQLGQWGAWSAVPGDLRRWARDYVVYYDLDPKLLGDTGNRAYAHAVMVFRRKERSTLLQEGLLRSSESGPEEGALKKGARMQGSRAQARRDPEPRAQASRAQDSQRHAPGPQAPRDSASPTDEELWQATKELVSFDVDRSPFFRDHATAAAATWADVFSRMVVHCAKHRKVGYVDSLVGEEYAVPASPFAGVPFAPAAEPAEHTVHLDDAEWVSYRFGRWKYHRAFSYSSADADLGKLVHALDRQMRVTWGYPKQLKERKVPRYQQTFLKKACEKVHGEEVRAREAAEEAERRKITFDFSKLSDIRAAAATTREALLVDEEREGYDPSTSGDAKPMVGVPVEVAPIQPDGAVSRAGGASPAGYAASQTGNGLTPDDAVPQAARNKVGSSPSPSPSNAGARPQDGSSPSDSAARLKGAMSPSAGTAQAQGSSLLGDSTAQAPVAADAPAQQRPPFGLTELEYQVALNLLNGKDVEGLLGPGTPSEEMLVDSINEKLFDELGDTAFEFGDQGPVPVEDYVDDVRALLTS